MAIFHHQRQGQSTDYHVSLIRMMQQSGDTIQQSGDKIQQSGDKIQLSGDKIQQSCDGRQQSGDSHDEVLSDVKWQKLKESEE